ncbi:DNA repair protein RecN [Bdellovibrio bacteriovorus]|uniref:DNA repair protein RecN n=1 Tax=Bdellovibrio bacteriovorus (strain ATCC 15356 / DSM 50701 / NCIMB 9529 / HD100) TaxID=264462 RepID=Q6MII4_BDEBA|nr:DNA repair protein RecN [Bdellovibrio bacteriovorus]AHZ83559.1 DNA repair protein [Bdellovibrio bacteriovorus]BEV69529.1 DNA repair protein RecN [Bdellovibrio bacteriovorus]CAE80929.1 DNA repair protein [Bdellovibrio bacteriovorus HD100]
MLLELKVSNFAIIENLHVSFKEGLNIMSGETGAGKSVLLKSLSLLMGGKGSSDTIRTGATQATIEGSFDISARPDIQKMLHDMGIEADEHTLIVRRVLSSGDKSKVYLNGSLSTLNSLRDIVAPMVELAGHSAPLIEMTGQHENRNLMSKHYHLDLLDQYAGTWDKRLLFTEKFNRYHAIFAEIKKLESDAKQKAQRLDFLTYQRDEIANLDLSPGEDHELEVEVKKLKNSNRIGAFVDQAESALYTDDDSAISRLNAILKKGLEISNVDPQIAAKLENLEQAKTLIDESIYDLRQYANKIDADPQRLEEAESRLSDLRKLQKKYGATVDDILKALMEMEIEISNLQNSESRVESLKKEAAVILKELETLGADLHKRRQKGAELLADSVNAELLDLNMKGVTFHVMTEKLQELASTGLSDVEFLSQTSSKDAKRPLAKFASGGELSRILLSLKRVVGSSNQPRTYLFDEVDTGVSGETAEKVGRKLRTIAKGQQVVCVTHLPQVAAFGDIHFFIQKSPQKDSVSMVVSELKQKDRVQEIARLISGEKISKTSLAHAEQLLAEAKQN